METRSNQVLVGTVVLALLVGLLFFAVWIAGLKTDKRQCYDIYFSQGVGGLNRGTNVSFSGVPVGQITKISLLPDRPEFVWVRIEVDQTTPVLQGTNAQIKGVGFTGVSEIQLDGAVKGAKPLTQLGPQGCPVIPSSAGGLGALLNSAPELLERIQRLTERLTELLSDRNQNAISDILENIDKTSAVLAERAPEMAQTLAEARVAARNAGRAADEVAKLANSSNVVVQRDVQPAAADLRKTLQALQQTSARIDSLVADAQPGVQNFSKSTLPEVNRLVRDLRDLTTSLDGVSSRLEQGGVTGVLGAPKLPDHKPGKSR
ncbi:MlaD family protein [Sphingomonas rosea]|jgi:phospholipid/cholesterol/gamma-HCH transport system substrate-binding protein|uniref:MlaD family protein n=1 Tax=Sphingomonas rosea TaxID=335605 RepID=A0ABP7TZ46_9SPHN